MKTLISALSIAVMVPSVWAQSNQQTAPTAAQKPESQGLRERVEQQVTRLNTNVDASNSELIQEIQAKYGFKVQCDGGYAGVMALSKDKCQVGLRSLDQALAKVDPGVARDQLVSVTIELTEKDQQGATLAEREVKIPYNTSIENMQVFMGEQVKLLFDTSAEELQSVNQRLVKAVKDESFFKVVASPDVQASEFHEGLQKLLLAARMSYGSVKPSEDEFKKFGIDTIVIGKKYKGLYEDQGELRLNVAFTERPGQMFEQIVNQLEDPDKRILGLRRSYFTPQYTWLQVQQTRADRAHVDEAREWLADNLPTHKVDCILDKDAPRSVTIAECREGLNKVRGAIVKYGKPQQTVQTERILVGDAIVSRSFVLEDQNALFLGYQASEDGIYKAVTNQ